MLPTTSPPPPYRPTMALAQVVEYHRLVTGFRQDLACLAANVTGATGHEDPHQSYPPADCGLPTAQSRLLSRSRRTCPDCRPGVPGRCRRLRQFPWDGANDAKCRFDGGGCEIRTHEGLATLPVFKTGAFNRSANPPQPDCAGFGCSGILACRQKPASASAIRCVVRDRPPGQTATRTGTSASPPLTGRGSHCTLQCHQLSSGYAARIGTDKGAKKVETSTSFG